MQLNYQYSSGLELYQLAKQFFPCKINKVVDLGCGTGNLLSFISGDLNDCNDFLGVDLSESMIKYARNKFSDKNINFIRQDVCQFLNSCQDNKFDIVFSNAALHWLSPLKLQEVFLNSYRTLKSGGVICFRFSLVDNGEELKKLLARVADSFPDIEVKDPAYKYNYEQVIDYFNRLNICLVFSKEKLNTSFSKSEMCLQWLQETQPVSFLNGMDKNIFWRKVSELIKSEKAKMKLHHGLFILKKSG
ncbi:class I SAM-dependent methyltransferase [Piscirickettsia litoralis]|uniref:class I SAM-dependent methyltransferase n=1 Tax=Piscirickettsia litoralis TaxID=1891921 RepID=UPI0013018B18|nr:class I SAM-dependent methyltransferase [Piscirickettsia litoralis]